MTPLQPYLPLAGSHKPKARRQKLKLLPAFWLLALGFLLVPAQIQGQRNSTPPATQPAGSYAIVGRAVLGGDAVPTPVRRARVTLSADNGFPTQLADTDTDGAFRFDRLPAGSYRLLIEKPGFILLEREGRAGVQPLAITLGDSPPLNLTVVMQRAAAIEGQLLGEQGEPVANVVVSAVRLGFGPYGRQPVAVRQGVSDDRGRFRVHTLPSGDYYLQAAPEPSFGISAPVPADRLGLGRSYYPGVARVDEARVVSLAPGQDLNDLDFKVSTVRIAAVSGAVTTAAGRPAAATTVRLQRVGGPPGEIRGIVPKPGEFLFPAVPPGEYWLLTTARPAPPGDMEYAATRVIVNGEDLKALKVSTARGAAVIGRVEVEGGSALPPNLQVVAAETEFEVPPMSSSSASSSALGSVAADGTFSFPLLFGPRLFRIDRLPANWGLKSVLLDGADATDVPVDFKASPAPRGVRLVITNRTASISGSLEAQTGGPTSGRMVVFSTDPRQWGMRSRAIKTVEVRADGRYAITGLVAGRYYIIGVEDLDDAAWFDPEVLSRLQATATPITLSESQRVTLSLVRR